MKEGVIEQVGTPKEIYQQPANKFVANFVGTANFISGNVTAGNGHKVDVTVDGVALKGLECKKDYQAGDPCVIVARPESVGVSKTEGLPCTITLSTFMGEYQYYEASYKGMTIQIHQTNPRSKVQFAAGEPAFLNLDAADLYVI